MTEGWGSGLSRLEIYRATRPMGVRIPRPPPLTSREASLLPGSLTVEAAVVRRLPPLLEIPFKLIEHPCRTGMLAPPVFVGHPPLVAVPEVFLRERPRRRSMLGGLERGQKGEGQEHEHPGRAHVGLTTQQGPAGGFEILGDVPPAPVDAAPLGCHPLLAPAPLPQPAVEDHFAGPAVEFKLQRSASIEPGALRGAKFVPAVAERESLRRSGS